MLFAEERDSVASLSALAGERQSALAVGVRIVEARRFFAGTFPPTESPIPVLEARPRPCYDSINAYTLRAAFMRRRGVVPVKGSVRRALALLLAALLLIAACPAMNTPALAKSARAGKTVVYPVTLKADMACCASAVTVKFSA